MKSRGETVVTVGKVRNMITQAIGLEALAKQEYGIAFKPRVSTYELEDGDVLLTCSDGIHDNLTDEEIREILEQHSDPVTMAIALQDRATTRTILEDSDRAKPDDATALVMKYTRKEAKTAVKKAA
jgi:serine/threonine protein phosphatase PrpC